jgi:hypothetical protein
MLKLQYRIKTGRKLNLGNPVRYTEKIQWYKLYYRDLRMVQCVDKYEVRSFIQSLGLETSLNECYGCFDSVDDIPFELLPNRFVLKDTLGSGGNSVIIVENKEKLDIKKIKGILDEWTKLPYNVPDAGREWPYYSGKRHRIVAEKYLDSDAKCGGLIDYKFVCFNGQPHYVWVLADRTLGHKAGCGIFDVDFNLLECLDASERKLARTIAKPDNYQEMLNYVKIIAKEFPQIRVDIYNQDNRIIFGEMTFYDASGYTIFDPDSFDFELGEKFILPPKKLH